MPPSSSRFGWFTAGRAVAAVSHLRRTLKSSADGDDQYRRHIFRVNLQLETVTSTFDLNSKDYVQSLEFIAGLGLLIAAFFLLAFITICVVSACWSRCRPCCCCCCGWSRRKSTSPVYGIGSPLQTPTSPSSEPPPTRKLAPIFYSLLLIIYALMILVGLVGGWWINRQLTVSIQSYQQPLLLASASSLATISYMQSALRTQQQAGKIPPTTFSALSSEVTSAIDTLVASNVLATKEANTLSTFERWRTFGLNVSWGIASASMLIAIYGTVSRKKSTLFVSIFVMLLGAVCIWVMFGVHLAFNVANGDACSDISSYLITGQINPAVNMWFICNATIMSRTVSIARSLTESNLRLVEDYAQSWLGIPADLSTWTIVYQALNDDLKAVNRSELWPSIFAVRQFLEVDRNISRIQSCHQASVGFTSAKKPLCSTMLDTSFHIFLINAGAGSALLLTMIFARLLQSHYDKYPPGYKPSDERRGVRVRIHSRK
mmetsp:Transcript_43620/g.70847  ORF Transcript_43620/g.70847 Transcript_43620/m.70847 type:complete len:488 (-) Transcript_43620:668-2131(-)